MLISVNVTLLKKILSSVRKYIFSAGFSIFSVPILASPVPSSSNIEAGKKIHFNFKAYVNIPLNPSSVISKILKILSCVTTFP